MSPRTLTRLEVDPGAGGAARLLAALPAALSGDGPALAPVDAALPRPLRATLDAAVRAEDPRAPLESDRVAMVVTTSGSTGDPVGVLLDGAALLAAGRAGLEALAGPGHWLVAVPVTSVGGLMTLVRGHIAGTDPVFWPGIAGAARFEADSFAVAAEELLARASGEPAYVSLVPTQLERVVQAGGPALAALTHFAAVIVGAAELPQTTYDAAAAAGVRVVRSYGMSETCGGICYEGVLLPGVSAHLESADETGVGRIVVGGRTLARGYRLAPGRTAERFRPDGLHTDDLGRIDAGRLTVVGRVDDVVQVGGTSVSLNAVAAVLRAQPGVADAAAVARPDHEWGVRIAAVVVAARSGALTDEPLLPRLQRAVSDRLGRLAAPVSVLTVDQLPLLPTGKPDRQALARMVQS